MCSSDLEIVVRAKPWNRYRAEIELARDEMIKVFNEANEGEENDVRCRYEAPTGSRIPQRVCFSTAQDRASANAASDFLQALMLAQELGMRPLQAHCHLGLAQTRCRVGHAEKARSEFHEAIELYKAMSMPFWLSGAKAALEKLGR